MVEYLKFIPKKRLENLFKTIHNDKQSAFIYESEFDIIEALAVFQPVNELKSLYVDCITPTIRDAKKGGLARIMKERQLKSYTLLKNILCSENGDCIQFVQDNLKNIQKLLLTSVQTKKHTSQTVRLA